MSKYGVGSTAEGAAFCRATEQYLPENEQLFTDPLAYPLLSGIYQCLLRSPKMRQYVIDQTEAAAKGLYGEQICRTRYIDEAASTAFQEGIRQLVILGAGFDSRAYRLPGVENVQVYEVDMPRVQRQKIKRLAKLLGELPQNVHFLPIDFAEQDLTIEMQRSSFDPTQPALFIWEAVTQYLNEDAVAKTLRFMGSCAPHSRIVFTYVLKWMIEHPERDPEAMKLIRLSKTKMAPFRFGLEPESLPAYLHPFHLQVLEDAGNSFYQQNYLRPIGRCLDVAEAERICLAEVIQ